MSFGPVNDIQHADERRSLRTVKSCGPDAPTLASSVAEGVPIQPDPAPIIRRRRWQESPVTGEITK
jgi:hypothetical protein